MYWQVIWLRLNGKGTQEVAQTCGFNPDWVRRIVRRYNEGGPDSLGDRRKLNRGRRLLTPAQQKELRDALTKPPPDGGLWSGPKVARWMEERLSRRVPPKRGWVYLRRLGFSVQVPRPRHPKAATKKQRTRFKKSYGVS